MTKEELSSTLKTLPLRDVKTDVDLDGSRFLAFVESPDFSNMDEAERQRLVWGHLRERFGDYDLVKVMFVFTNSPEESAAASAE